MPTNGGPDREGVADGHHWSSAVGADIGGSDLRDGAEHYIQHWWRAPHRLEGTRWSGLREGGGQRGRATAYAEEGAESSRSTPKDG